ncbi:hypothetical protein MRB53_034503 [Persea americana]|uniref:Uncharacterized protein n=1 Tax=Persea americana TaxID=3435 RepID=A0ACC2K1Y4_PERAE|nr:hypothetical protein MRB53_034503 [Persea americana]
MHSCISEVNFSTLERHFIGENAMYLPISINIFETLMDGGRDNGVIMQPPSSKQDVIAGSGLDDMQSGFRYQTPKLEFNLNLSNGVLDFTIIPFDRSIGAGKLAWWHSQFFH